MSPDDTPCCSCNFPVTPPLNPLTGYLQGPVRGYLQENLGPVSLPVRGLQEGLQDEYFPCNPLQGTYRAYRGGLQDERNLQGHTYRAKLQETKSLFGGTKGRTIEGTPNMFPYGRFPMLPTLGFG